MYKEYDEYFINVDNIYKNNKLFLAGLAWFVECMLLFINKTGGVRNEEEYILVNGEDIFAGDNTESKLFFEGTGVFFW